MTVKQNATPGCWESNINANLVANGGARLADIRCQQGKAYWLESVAAEQGRMTIMQHQQGVSKSILPHPFNARSKVHEYGGSPYCLAGDSLYFVNAKDQGIYQLALNENAAPQKIHQADSTRFGDLIWVESLQLVIAVCEQHGPEHKVDNSIVSINRHAEVKTLVSGSDFYAYPRFCPNNQKLCWITWQHPYMPWDTTQLWVGDLNQSGELENTTLINDTPHQQSIVQPHWHNNGDLYYVSDQDNWWNLYRIEQSSLNSENREISPINVHPNSAEYATPLWVLGMQNFCSTADALFAASTNNGQWQLEKININNSPALKILSDFSSIDSVCTDHNAVYFIGSKPNSFSSIYRLDIHTNTLTKISAEQPVDTAELSSPISMTFPVSVKAQNADLNTIHAFYYPPHNAAFKSTSRPPLIVLCHGGPTGQTSSELNYKIQYWTNRGFAIVDINYRGSTGFGRHFRRSLYDKWGLSDVEDMETVVNGLINQGKADPNKIIIKGSSAGGYTVLAALAFTDRFSAGVSLYGIGDLELLAKDTHKFEKHYLDQLVGPYPEQQAEYQARSPINSVEKFECPLLLFQGLEDDVVPPNQARLMESSVNKKGIPVALVEFADEGHGFRSPKNIEHMLEAELYFYQRVFQLSEHKDSNLLNIKNLD